MSVHSPAPEHFEEFIDSCRQVIEAGRTQPGFLRADVWVTPDGEAVVTTAAFESQEDFQAAADAAGPMPEDLEVRPRQVHFLLWR